MECVTPTNNKSTVTNNLQVVSDEDIDNMTTCGDTKDGHSSLPISGDTLILTGQIVPNSCQIVQTSISSNQNFVFSNSDNFENYLETCELDSNSKKSNQRHFAYALILCFIASYFLYEGYMSALVFLSLCFVLPTRILCPMFYKKNGNVRIVKWAIDEFPDRIKTGFLASPIFKSSSCQWRLVVKQKTCAGAPVNKSSIGLILTNISRNIRLVNAKMSISISTSNGNDLMPELKELTLVQSYESEGDCGFSDFIPLDLQSLLTGQLSIKCRIEINLKSIGIWKKVVTLMSPGYKLETIQKGPRQVFEVGKVVPEQEDWYYNYDGFHRNKNENYIVSFLQYSETKTFIWNIPDALQILENSGVEYWDIFSPSFVISSNGICSIWRLKFVEIHGVLRLHLQLRGLPRRIPQIKVRYVVEILDNFGDFVTPEQCSSSAKYPDYLSLWETTRMPLYSYDNFMKRFVATDAGIKLRISIQADPVETNLFYPMDTTYTDWIPYKRHPL